MNRILGVAAAIVMVGSQAHGACRDELPDVKQSIYKYHHVDPGRFSAALHWWNLAAEYEPADEVSCLNYLAKAQKVLEAQLPPVDCEDGIKDGPLPPHCPAIGYAPPDAPFVLVPGGTQGGGGTSIGLPANSGVPSSAPGTARSD
jgi:hypothetical protein